jgi:hypothetical protein
MRPDRPTPPFEVRPGIDSLLQRPTLLCLEEPWGKMELKLETDDFRYWVTTEGLARRSRGSPVNYVVNYVTVEKLSADGSWELSTVYSPDAWKLSQGFDYCQLLHRELQWLQKQLDRDFRWDLIERIEDVHEELRQANEVIFALTEQVTLSGHDVPVA